MKTNKVDGDIIISTEEGLHSRISGNRSWEEMEVSTSDLMEGPSILAQPTAEDNIIDTNYNHDVTVPSSRPSLVKSTPSEAENDKVEEKIPLQLILRFLRKSCLLLLQKMITILMMGLSRLHQLQSE